jgi:hypothetical protein
MGALPLFSNLTITGWFRPSTNDLARAVLVQWSKAGTNYVLRGLSGGPSDARSRLRFTASPFSLHSLDAFSGFEPLYSSPGQWAFFAVVIRRAEAPTTVTFARGSISNPASVSSTSSFANPALVDISGTVMTIGSDEAFRDPFRGYLDRIAVFTEALTLEEVERVRLHALAPERLRLTAGQLRWPTRPNRIYQVESSDNLWDWNVESSAVQGNGEEQTHALGSQNGTKRFYRLRIE